MRDTEGRERVGGGERERGLERERERERERGREGGGRPERGKCIHVAVDGTKIIEITNHLLLCLPAGKG